MRLSAADLAGEKHALVKRLSAGDPGGENMSSSCDLVLATLVAKRMRLLSRLSAGDPGGEHKQLDAYNAHVL